MVQPRRGVDEIDPMPSNWLRSPWHDDELALSVLWFYTRYREGRVLVHCRRGFPATKLGGPRARDPGHHRENVRKRSDLKSGRWSAGPLVRWPGAAERMYTAGVFVSRLEARAASASASAGRPVVGRQAGNRLVGR